MSEGAQQGSSFFYLSYISNSTQWKPQFQWRLMKLQFVLVMDEMLEQYRFHKEWASNLRKVSETTFCHTHHFHKHELEALNFFDILIKYQREQGSDNDNKVQKLKTFLQIARRYEPDIDFSVAAHRKAVEIDRKINDKPNQIIKNYERKKLQYRLGKNCQKNMALHKLAELSQLTETMESICKL